MVNFNNLPEAGKALTGNLNEVSFDENSESQEVLVFQSEDDVMPVEDVE